MYLAPTSNLFPNMEAIVEYNYTAQQDDELTLRKGDIITGIKMMLGGWWEGTLRDKRGMFPDNFVKVLDPTKTSSGSSETTENAKSDDVTIKDGSSKRFCKVLFTYEPCNDDELTLELDDVIEFFGEVEEGWWTGRLRGKVGVFPSNFVSPPVPEVQEKHKERDKKELCRVLFPYEADNEDELTLVEGDIITLLSRDAFDKGWWKGELRGQVGLFPDNFVEVITVKDENETVVPVNVKANNRTSLQMDIVAKSHTRKSLDAKNSSNKSDSIKKVSTPSSSMSTSTGSIGGSEKKPISGHSIISSLKRLVSDVGNNNGIGNTSAALEELDGVERREGTLSHLTASRAKAPRRRPPSSQHLHYHATTSVNRNAAPTLPSPPNNTEDNLSNGRTDTVLEQTPNEETDGLVAKARKKAPWVEELKLNQMERKRNAAAGGVDKHVKTERNISRTTNLDSPHSDDELSNKPKNRIQKTNINPHADHNPASSSEQSGYVPYVVYSKLLERVATLEEKQSVLQHTIEQLSEMLIPLLSNQSINNKS